MGVVRIRAQLVGVCIKAPDLFDSHISLLKMTMGFLLAAATVGYFTVQDLQDMPLEVN